MLHGADNAVRIRPREAENLPSYTSARGLRPSQIKEITASAQLKPNSLTRVQAGEFAVAYSPQPLAFTLPSGFVRPLDSHTCYTPWPVFRDVTDGAGLNATPPGFLIELI